MVQGSTPILGDQLDQFLKLLENKGKKMVNDLITVSKYYNIFHQGWPGHIFPTANLSQFMPSNQIEADSRMFYTILST